MLMSTEMRTEEEDGAYTFTTKKQLGGIDLY